MDTLIYNEIIERIRTKFIEFNVDFEQFNELLLKNNAFISGSFLLQVIQNEFYPAATYDIDIFTFGEKNIKFENEINDIIKKSILQKILKKKLNIIRNNIGKDDTDKNISDVDEYTNNVKHNVKHTVKHNQKKTQFLDHNKIVNKNADLDKIDFNRPIDLNKKLIKGYIPDNNTDYVNINLDCDSYKINIISKYKSINRCEKKSIRITNLDYNCDKINEIVDFQVSNDIMSKYQLIYYDDNVIKTPEDILKGFDFDFCANYWNGKDLFIKDLNSINSKSCILNLNKPRIYKNQNKRIFKYIERNFKININYNGDIYEVVYLNFNNINKKKLTKISDNTNNLILMLETASLSITNILNNLPFGLEKLIIYTHNNEEIIDNLPITLQELRLYLWNYGSGIEEGFETEINSIAWGKNRLRLPPNSIAEIKKKDMDTENNAIKNLKKIPFGCNVYVNDKLIEL